MQVLHLYASINAPKGFSCLKYLQIHVILANTYMDTCIYVHQIHAYTCTILANRSGCICMYVHVYACICQYMHVSVNCRWQEWWKRYVWSVYVCICMYLHVFWQCMVVSQWILVQQQSSLKLYAKDHWSTAWLWYSA